MRHPAKRLKRSKGIVENASADLANEALIWGQDFSVSSVDDSGEVGQGESEHENDDNDPWESAIARLEGYGVDRREARAALEATQGVRDDRIQWVNGALSWICDQKDVQRECQEMRLAMAQSLREHQETVEAELPLEKKSPQDLRALFKGSEILQQLDRTMWSPTLFSSPLKGPLTQFLNLEKRCLEQWYPGCGTAQFFVRVGQECLGCLGLGSAALTSAAPVGPPPIEPAARSTVTGNKRSRSGKQSKNPPGTKCGRREEAGSMSSPAKVLVTFFERKVQLVLEAVSRMPGTSGETPDIFKGNGQEAEKSDSEIEIVEVSPQPRTENVVSLE